MYGLIAENPDLRARKEITIHTNRKGSLTVYNLEDPATGSGNSAFGYYMLKNRMWDGKPAVIEQGGEDRVFNSVALATRGERVLFGGRGTLRIRGEYCI